MLNKIIAFSIHNKFIVGLMTLLLIVWGAWSATQIPIDAVPDITNNQVQIITVSPSLATQEVEQLVTFPIEQSIANLPDLKELRSISRFGLSVITAVFEESVDIYFARQLISQRLEEAADKIPEGVGSPEMAPVSTGLGEVYQYIIHPKKGSEDKYTAMQLRTMQDWIVSRQLLGTPGVAEINSFGGKLKQYEVAVNPNRLVAMDVTISDIFMALESNNENTGGAYIDKKPNAYFIRGIGLIRSFEDIENIVVKSNPNGIPILIKDVAKVQWGNAIRYGAVTYNGEKEVVGGVVMMLKGANSSEVVGHVNEKMAVIQKSLPDDIVIEPYLDRMDLIGRAIATVEKNLIEGALIVIFVLVVFLGNLRAGLIVASAIPLSLLFALGMMRVFGVSANLMSLGAIDFGLIVDGAVIVVEATLHHLGLRKSVGRLSQAEMDKEVFLSASKIRSSAAFGEIIILIVYIPILTLTGTEGKMFGPMAKTVGFAILGALILSLTYIPMMCAWLLPKKASNKKTFADKMMDAFQRIYQPLLEKSIRFKKIVVAVTLLLFALSVFLFSRMGGEFIPQLQEGDFAMHCILPQGSSLSQSIETSMHASRILRTFDEVKMVVGKTGTAEVPTDPMPPEATDLIVVLKPKDDWKSGRTYDELASAMMKKLEVIPGVFFEKSQPIQMRFNELMTGVRQDVAIKIFGENLDTLEAYANKTATVVQGINGATDPMVERIAGLPQINIEYNRAQIANYGLNIEDVNHLVSTAFAGGIAGVVYENERRFDLVVRLDSTYRQNIDNVRDLYIPVSSGVQIPLSQIADIKMKLGPAQISREDGKRRIVVGFNVKGADVETVVENIQARLARTIDLPEGYYFTFGGAFENLKEASARLMVAVPIALALIFVLLYFTFNSMKQAVLIFTAIPMSAIGGVFALLLRGMPFSISAGIGFIALFGVAVLNGIVLIGRFNQLEKEGMDDIFQRTREGTKARLRPVLMTATVASLGFLPMALSQSAGAEVQRPLATVVIGGLVTATFLTLFVLPILYLMFASKWKMPNAKRGTTLILLSIAFCSPAFGQTKANDGFLTVERAIELALKNNLKLQSLHLQVQSDRYVKKSAFELPKTQLNYQYGQFNSIRNDNEWQVTQNIPFPTYFFAKSGLYKAELKSSELQEELSANQIKAEVKSVFHQLQYLLHRKALLLQLDSLYADFLDVATLRYETGETGLLEKSTAIAQKGELQLMVNENETALSIAYSTLAALLNFDGDINIAQSTKLKPLVLTTALDTSLASNHPSVKLLYQNARVVRQNKKVELAQTLPDFTLGYFNQSITGFQTVNNEEQYFDTDNRFSGFSVGIGIPLTFFSNAIKIKSYEYERQALRKKADNQKRMLQGELEGAFNNYAQYLSQYNYYQQKAMPNAKLIVDAAILGFKNGEIGYMEYVRALQTATDIRLNYLESIHRLNQSVITINFLLNN